MKSKISVLAGCDGLPPNGLGMSRAAPIDRESNRADTNSQNRRDLARR